MFSGVGERSGPDGRSAGLLNIRQWAIWSLPGRLILPVLLVEFTASALVLGQIPTTRLDSRIILLALSIGGLGVLHAEIALRVERVRRRITDTPHVDFSSVWTFAGAVLLPPAVAATVAIVVFTHLWIRSWRPQVRIYRHVYSTATIVLACLAAAEVLSWDRGQHAPFLVGGGRNLVLLVLAVLVYTTVNSSLVAGVYAVSESQTDLATVLGGWRDVALETATLSLGALAAMVMSINPWLIVFVLPPLILLHQATLVQQLEVAANTDQKTGLLNAAAWHMKAERALRRGGGGAGPGGVLVLDLDHFKRVNDAYGHLAGDHVLQAVANALRDEVRDRDLVGRFGGEEFVVLLAALPGGGAAELATVAERIRRRVEGLQVEIPTPDGPMTVGGLTVSIGGAVHSRPGEELRTLLHIADTALYAAKRAGRNTVRMGLSLPVPAQRVGRELLR
jgi:diguanylate cyclase (GGDEF)-like protein